MLTLLGPTVWGFTVLRGLLVLLRTRFVDLAAQGTPCVGFLLKSDLK